MFIDSEGRLPAKLTTWEQLAVKEELDKRPLGWLRNLPNKRWSLCVPYEGPGSFQKGLYPDFVFVRRVSGKLVADIIDPHLTALDDAWRKAKGMAQFAQRHGASFGRIELVQVVDGATKRVDLMDEEKRKRVLGVSSNDHLRDIFLGV